jgi:hypothetical protein
MSCSCRDDRRCWLGLVAGKRDPKIVRRGQLGIALLQRTERAHHHRAAAAAILENLVELGLHLRQVLGHSLEVVKLSLPQLAPLVPVRDLQAHEDAGHDDQELDRDRQPVLSSNRMGEFAENHASVPQAGSRRTLTEPAVKSTDRSTARDERTSGA